MELSKQVCTLEQAKRLKELGVRADALFYHITNVAVPSDGGVKMFSETQSWKRFRKVEDGGVIKYYPAYTVAELGLALRAYSGIGHSFYNEHTHRGKGGWGHTHTIWGKGIQPILDYYDSEAEARAAMLIHLLENGFITAEEVNKRLFE